MENNTTPFNKFSVKTTVLILILLFSLLYMLIPVKADEIASGTCGRYLTWTLDEEGSLTVSGTGNMYYFNSSRPVPWEDLTERIRSVYINDGVTSIGNNAFRNCSNLTSVSIADSVTAINDCAFFNCSNLTNIAIPDSVTDIGRSVFQYCRSLTDITLSKNIKRLEEGVFYDCSSLSSISIPGSVSYIGNHAFYNCCNLTADIIIPDGVTSILEKTFCYCENITSISLPDSLNSIDDEAFYLCSKLTNITIPDSVTSIGEEAFAYCYCLTDLSIPSGVTSIGDKAFGMCFNLETITVDPQNPIYDSRENCNALIETNTGKLIKGCNNSTIPNGVISISSAAFNNCKGLVSISFPDSLKTIDSGAFYGCINLSSDIIVPEGVTCIEPETFMNCYSIPSITLPSSLISIEEHAFDRCTSLKAVYIPEGVTDIGDYAFCNCFSLSDVVIPTSVTNIGRSAFFGAKNIISVSITPNVTLGIDALYNAEIADLYFDGSESEWQSFYEEYLSDYPIHYDQAFTSEQYQGSFIPEITAVPVPGGYAITITSEGPKIVYTLDGSIPNTTSIPYSGTFIIDTPGEYFINARAFGKWNEAFGPVNTIYIHVTQSTIPVFQEENGYVTISGQGDIYYSFDLTEDPSICSYKYTSPLLFFETTVIKARCIELGKAVSNVTGYTYYAGLPSGITYPNGTYSFANINESFGYTGLSYKIPRERYQEIFGDAIGQFLYDIYGDTVWGGSCFGMSATALLFHKGILNLSNYSEEAENVNALLAPSSPESLLTKLIECYQISQFLPVVMLERGDETDGGNMVISSFPGNHELGDSLLDAIRKGLTGGDPVILIVWRQDLDGSHAVVPYKLENNKIYVYDCNKPGQENIITYEINGNGNYSFHYGQYSYAISYNLFSTLMNGLESGIDIENVILQSEEGSRILVHVDSPDITILNSLGEQANVINYRTTEDIEANGTVVCLDSGSYKIVNNDSSRTTLTITAVNNCDYQTMTVNNGSSVIEIRDRNGRLCISASSESTMNVVAYTKSSAGFENHISVTSTYAEVYTTTDRTTLLRTKTNSAILNGIQQDLTVDETDRDYYYGVAVKSDKEEAAEIYTDETYILNTDISSLPGNAFHLTVQAFSGDEDALLYVTSYDQSGRQIAIKEMPMIPGKTRYVFCIDEAASEVKVYMLSTDGYYPLWEHLSIQ